MFMRFPGGRSRAFTLSYDDGSIQDVRLSELMQQYGLKGTFNIPSSFLGEGHTHHISYDTLRELSKKGCVEVAGHGETHPFYAHMAPAQVIRDLSNDRVNLERELKTLVRGFALPNGSYNAETVECLRLCGFVYSRTTKSTKGFSIPADFLEWHPTCHQIDPALDGLIDDFFGDVRGYGSPKLFYVWGHSYEMDRDCWSWERLEAFFKKVAGRDDVWYATNMEIYDYVKAYKALIPSADGSFVYNPTDVELFGLAGPHLEPFSVKPRETLWF